MDAIPLAVTNAAELPSPPPAADRGGVPPTYYADDFVILDVGSLDAWLRDVSRLQTQIRSVNRDLDQLERLQVSCMDAPGPGNSPWNRAETMAADVQARLGVIRSKVRNLSTLRSNSLSASDQRLANVHEQMLLHHLMDVTKRFMDMQHVHAQRTREVFQRQLKIAKPDITTSELDWVISSTAAPQVFADSLLIEQERRRQVQSRHHDLVKLEASIAELQQMFSDLALLLEQQEAQVDSVAQFVESGVNVLEAGGGQVNEAARIARSTRRKKWWLLLFTLLLGGAIAAVVLGITLPTPKRVGRPPPVDAQPMRA
ncbi:t-SNARE [Catenaria anguillulae PL171]|uniref:t-SNARE n=1 Tax=Catenaria anguillulae PL171 TaxID=765915 RepID=A0A1Y2HQ97_9FUNG|nr:t-SNARE [Catenaria anguillulae PL171]